MRSFLTRLVNSVPRAVLPVPCMLICLACATPFPIENLEEGMTAETVRESFGEPEAIGTEPPFGVATFWTYTHEEQDWFVTLHPMAPLIAAVIRVSENEWHNIYVTRKPLVLHFEAEKLVRWEVIEPAPVVSSGYDALGALDDMQKQQREWQRIKDIQHHKKGHKHHHD